MNSEDIKWQIDRDESLRTEVNQTYFNAIGENIKSTRSLATTIITLSAGVIGFTIPVVGNSTIVATQALLILGLFFLLAAILYSLYVLKTTLEKENTQLHEQQTRYNQYLDMQRDARNKYFDDPTEENLRNWNNIGKDILSDLEEKAKTQSDNKDHSLSITYLLFFCGLLLITLSLVDYQFFYTLLAKPK